MVRNDENGALGVVLNRPAATEGAPQLSQALCAALEGDGADRVGVEAFNGAFGKTIAAYVGKPAARDGGDQPAMVIHGVSDLEGASELAPGLGIYRGGAAAAAESVAGGAAEPLDFRFFIGRYEWGPGELARDVRDGVYRPAACSRGVALKQHVAARESTAPPRLVSTKYPRRGRGVAATHLCLPQVPRPAEAALARGYGHARRLVGRRVLGGDGAAERGEVDNVSSLYSRRQYAAETSRGDSCQWA